MYLLCREDIFSPIIESQVISNLIEISKDTNINIYFVWIKRIDYCFFYKKEINKTISLLESHNIKVLQVPVIIGRFPLSKGMFNILKIQVIGRLNKIIDKYKINLVHSRSYNSGLLAKILKERKKIIHIFDPRSPFLSEIKSTFAINETAPKYLFWQKAEHDIVSTADATIGISEEFCNYLKKFNEHVLFIPNNVDVPDIKDIHSWTISQKRKSICYIGSLGYGWNDVREYIHWMKKIISYKKDVKFEIYVTKICIPVVQKELKSSGISRESYILDTLPRNKILKTIAGCLAGMQIMSKKDNRLGVKSVDYLAAGIPILCNDNAVGAANLVKKTNFGWNVDDNKLSQILNEIEKFNNNLECVKYAEQNFSTRAISRKYINIYKLFC